MPTRILLHLPRGAEDENVALVTNVVGEMLSLLNCRLVSLATKNMPSALQDLRSDFVLCVRCERPLNPKHMRALRMATHHRFQKNPEVVRKQLKCDIFKTDESRVEAGWKADKRNRDKSSRAHELER